MLASETASLEEVAAALGRKPGWLMRNWLKLHVDKGFPRKIPTGWVWPRRMVEVWLRSGGAIAPLPMPANQNGADDDVVSRASEALRARYGATQ